MANDAIRGKRDKKKPETVPCALCGRDCDIENAYEFDAGTPYCSEACAVNDLGSRS